MLAQAVNHGLQLIPLQRRARGHGGELLEQILLASAAQCAHVVELQKVGADTDAAQSLCSVGQGLQSVLARGLRLQTGHEQPQKFLRINAERRLQFLRAGVAQAAGRSWAGRRCGHGRAQGVRAPHGGRPLQRSRTSGVAGFTGSSRVRDGPDRVLRPWRGRAPGRRSAGFAQWRVPSAPPHRRKC